MPIPGHHPQEAPSRGRFFLCSSPAIGAEFECSTKVLELVVPKIGVAKGGQRPTPVVGCCLFLLTVIILSKSETIAPLRCALEWRFFTKKPV